MSFLINIFMKKRFFSFAAVLGLFLFLVVGCDAPTPQAGDISSETSAANSSTESQQKVAAQNVSVITPAQTAQVSAMVNNKVAVASKTPVSTVNDCSSVESHVLKVTPNNVLDGVASVQGVLQAEKRMGWGDEYDSVYILFNSSHAPQAFVDYQMQDEGSTIFTLGAIENGNFSSDTQITKADSAAIMTAYRSKDPISLKLYFIDHEAPGRGSPNNFTKACLIKVIK